MRYPLAESIAQKIKISLCVTACGDTRELYGYTRFVFDAEKAKAAFLGEYSALAKQLKRSSSPTWWELENAIDILEARAGRVVTE